MTQVLEISESDAAGVLVPRYFSLSSWLYGKHNGSVDEIVDHIKSALGNEAGVGHVFVERDRIVAMCRPSQTDVDALLRAVRGVLKHMAGEYQNWGVFPFLELGRVPTVTDSDVLSSMASNSSTLSVLTSPDKRVYSFNGFMVDLVDGELDNEMFGALVASLRADLGRISDVIKVHIARGRIGITYTVDCNVDQLDEDVTAVVQAFFQKTQDNPKVFPSLKRENTSLKIDKASVPC